MLIQMPIRNVRYGQSGGVNIVLAREQIQTGDVSPALRALLPLTDNHASVLQYAGALSITIRGYDDEPGLLCEITAVRRWMTELTEHFPYWLHFCADKELILILSLVTPISIARRVSTDTIAVHYPVPVIEMLLAKMTRDSQALYREVGLSPAASSAQRLRMETLADAVLAQLH